MHPMVEREATLDLGNYSKIMLDEDALLALHEGFNTAQNILSTLNMKPQHTQKSKVIRKAAIELSGMLKCWIFQI